MESLKDRTSLRFAVMCNDFVLQQWQLEVIESLVARGNAEPVLLIMPNHSGDRQRSIFSKTLQYPWDKVIFRKYYRYFFRPKSFRKADLRRSLPKLSLIKARTTLKKKYSEYFSENDIASIQAFKPDFILKFGFGIIRGEILSCVPMGVWSFHHGNEQKYRGVPPAFWEIFKNDRITASILQRLTETLDGGVILRKGYFPTIQHSWKANLEQAIFLSQEWPADVCREVLEQYTFPSYTDAVSTRAPIYREPGNFTMLQFLLKLFINRVKFHYFEMFFTERWETGIVKTRTAEINGGIDYTLDTASVSWLGADEKHRYFADGFSLKNNERLLLLFEDYSYKTRKAVISTAWFSEREEVFSEPVCALREDWHLSYPFLFKHDNKVLCIPESMQHGAIELYELNLTTQKLHHIRTLVPEVHAADPTLVFHQNHWFLFFTPAHATNVELNIWHADTLEGPFVPHLLNPVKSDIGNARPAGAFFVLDGKLYRPAQDCSRTYGGRVIINEIKVLTEDFFLEMPVSTIEPPPGYQGLHNLSFSGDYMFFDCKKYAFIPASFRYQFKRRLGMIR